MARGIFGERLKRERELREVSLEEVAKSTRIGTSFLEALENEQWEKLPGGIFNRGFVRAIAHYLGLSEEDLLSEYDVARAEQKPETPIPPESAIPRPSIWIPIAAVFLILCVIVALGFGGRYGWRRYAAYRAAPIPQHLLRWRLSIFLFRRPRRRTYMFWRMASCSSMRTFLPARLATSPPHRNLKSR